MGEVVESIKEALLSDDIVTVTLYIKKNTSRVGYLIIALNEMSWYSCHAFLEYDFDFYLPLLRSEIELGNIDMLCWSRIVANTAKTLEITSKVKAAGVSIPQPVYHKLVQSIIVDICSTPISAEEALYLYLIMVLEPKVFLESLTTPGILAKSGWTYSTSKLVDILSELHGSQLLLDVLLGTIEGVCILDIVEDNQVAVDRLRDSIPSSLL